MNYTFLPFDLQYAILTHEFDPLVTKIINITEALDTYDLLLKVENSKPVRLLRNVTKEVAYDAAHYHAVRFGVPTYRINGVSHSVSDMESAQQAA